MNILAFDTSTGHCSVALLFAGKTYTIEGQEASLQAEKLFLLIEELLGQAGANYKALQSVAVTIGPGSFTGVRIGLSAAQGIALAAGIPLIGVSSLEAIYWEALTHTNPQHYPVLAVMDARRNQLYVQYFNKEGRAASDPMLLGIEEVSQYFVEEPFIIAGSGSALLKDIPPHAIQLNTVTIPRAAMLLSAAQHKQQQGNVEALYIREPDAKVKSSGVK